MAGPEFRPQDYFESLSGLKNIRDDTPGIRHLTGAQTSDFLQHIGRDSGIFIEQIYSEKDDVTKEMTRIKEVSAEEREGSAPSALYLTTRFIQEHSLLPIRDLSLQCYRDPKLPKRVFSAYFDFAVGIFFVTSNLLKADEIARARLAGVPESQFINNSDDKIMDRDMQWDPNGFLIIDKTLSGIHENIYEVPGTINTSMAISYNGAKFTKLAHSHLLPFAKNVIAHPPSKT